jgi:nicotinate phosphoribosyltransferase
VELRRGHRSIPRVKLSPSKVTIPELKQVFRSYSDTGRIREDVIAIHGEEPPDPTAQPLLTKVIERGVLACEVPSLPDIREYGRKQTERLPEEFKELMSLAEPPVRLSTKLSELCEKLYHGIV